MRFPRVTHGAWLAWNVSMKELAQLLLVRSGLRKARSLESYEVFFDGRRGIELGGPSTIFSSRGLLPVYPSAGRIDVAVYSNKALSSRAIATSRDDSIRRGVFLELDAVDLRGIPDGSYDFALASHVLEHIANPLKALREWGRVLQPGGVAIIVVPDKRRTFDRRRATTPVEHLVEDGLRNVGEDDLTHVDEVIERHDPSIDPNFVSKQELEERLRKNLERRSMHHHVFSLATLTHGSVLAGFVPVDLFALPPYHLVLVAKKPAAKASETLPAR